MTISAIGRPLNTSAEELLAALDDSRREPALTRERMLLELQSYEDSYGYASADVRALVRDGVLTETHELCSWMFTYDALLRFRS